ncbi:MAG: hypothetical protein AAF127_03400 [Pseudomonadota bacterium]
MLALLTLPPTMAAHAAPQDEAMDEAPADSGAADAKQSTIATWSPEKQASYASWPPTTQDYYWTLAPERQKMFWGLADTDKVTLSNMSAEDQATAWDRIEARSGTPEPQG